MVSDSSAVTTQRRLVKAVICLVGAVRILRKTVRASIVVGRGRGFASAVNAPQRFGVVYQTSTMIHKTL